MEGISNENRLSQEHQGLIVVLCASPHCHLLDRLPRSLQGTPAVDAEVGSSLSILSFTQERGTEAAADGKGNSCPDGKARFGGGGWRGVWSPGSRCDSCCGFGWTRSAVGAQAAPPGWWWSAGKWRASSLLQASGSHSMRLRGRQEQQVPLSHTTRSGVNRARVLCGRTDDSPLTCGGERGSDAE